ncbi:MAG: LysR family transcriptional regulator [Crocinitomicaceae bacterium]|nr:LysR family transcriptional regulator [Crocinitomicaceae bacterium]
MNYTLSQLSIFLKVVENESITKAAAELLLTQPAVSIQLKNFQAHFDLPLTQVVNRKLYITEFGKEIAQTAERILLEANEIKYKTALYKGKISGQLKISVVSTGKYVIPYFLTDFLASNSAIELKLDVSNKNKIIKDLETNSVDFSLVSVLPDKLNLDHIKLMKNQLFLISNMDFDKEINSIHDLPPDIPFIFREFGSATRIAMENFLNKQDYAFKRTLELTSNEAVKQAVISKLGVSIMPLIGIKNELNNKQLKIIPIKNLPITSEWNLVWTKGKRMFPAAKAFIQFIEKEKERIIRDNFSWYENYQ